MLAESLLHHLPGQPDLAARLLGHLLHGAGSTTHNSLEQQPQQQRGDQGLTQRAAAAECAVLGAGSRLPVACLTLQERHGLMRWVAACTPVDQAARLQRDLSRMSSRHQQQQQQHPELEEPGAWQQDWAQGDTSSSRQPYRGGFESTATGSHLQQLVSPRGGWPQVDAGGAGSGENDLDRQALQGSEQQLQHQQQRQVRGRDELLQEIRRLQHTLGQPAQREWVTTVGPLPTLANQQQQQSTGLVCRPDKHQEGLQQQGKRRLKAAVAAAVAAAAGGNVGSGHVVPGLPTSSPPVPPSRLYVQEADGEMRLATVLVTQQGL